MKRVVIIGAGGHAREVAEILRHQAQQRDGLPLLGFVDDDIHLRGKVISGSPVLGDWSWFEGIDRSEVAIVCAVGLPGARKLLAERAVSSGLSFINAVSPLAYVSPGAQVGQGVMIFPHTFVSTETFIGDHTILNVGATVSHDTKLGRYSTVNPGVHLAGNVSIGEGCYLGIGSSVIHGITIGAWTTLGAGGVAVRDLPGDVIAVGVPARVVRTREKLQDE